MNVKISVFVICVEVIVYFLLHNLGDCIFNKIFSWSYMETILSRMSAESQMNAALSYLSRMQVFSLK